MKTGLKIGVIARRASVTVDAVRYYERRGLLPTPARSDSGYRSYDESIIARLRFIKALQTLGFSLDEIRPLLDAADAETATCQNQRHRIITVMTRIDEQIDRLRKQRERLERTLGACENNQCTIIPALKSKPLKTLRTS